MASDIERHEVDTFIRNQQAIMLQLAMLESQMRDVLTEIGGAPDSNYRSDERPSIRSRLHSVETRAAADDLAREALRSARQKSWGRTHLLALLLISAIGALGTLLRLFGISG